jgi:CDP-diacylglycerol--glycerol-3-phosphate 3-phosphatidyltransferase/cardiolipin synthase
MGKFEPKFSSNYSQHRRTLHYLPSVVTVLRLFALPLLIFSIGSGQIFCAYTLFLIAALSDVLDGGIARKLGVSSKIGARLDVIVDFVFISGMFFWFTYLEVYPTWILLLIIGMFAQFIVTSCLLKMMYDPFGKYYGSLLYGAIGLTLLFSGYIFYTIVMFSLVGITVASLVSRIIYTLKMIKRRG